MKKSTITNYRQGLSKYLKEHCSIDISKDVQFAGSNDVFNADINDLKNKIYASTDHKPHISKEEFTEAV